MDPEARQVRINWKTPDTVPSVYATHFVIQRIGAEVVLGAFQVRPPVVTGNETEKVRLFQTIDSVDAVCVARVIMDGERAQQLLRLLSENLTPTKAR